jgi:hypothetical protein
MKSDSLLLRDCWRLSKRSSKPPQPHAPPLTGVLGMLTPTPVLGNDFIALQIWTVEPNFSTAALPFTVIPGCY